MIAVVLRPLLALLLLGSLVLAPAATAATSQQTITAILRDCEDDGALSGSYRPSELRDARRNIGTDLDQYSDCRDVLSAAELRSAGGGRSGGGDGGAAAGGRSGGGGRSGSDGGGGASDSRSGSGQPPSPPTAEEQGVLDQLLTAAPGGAEVAGRPVALGAASLRGGAHDLPTPLLVALGLLLAAAAAASVPALRRRVPALRRRVAGRRSPA